MSDYAFSYDDLDDLIGSAAMPGGGTVADMDFSNYFSDSGPAFDFGTLDANAFSYDDFDAMLNDAALGIGDFNFDTSALEINPRRILVPDYDFGSKLDLGSFEDLAGVDAVNTAAENASNFDDFIQRYSQDSDGEQAIPFGESASNYRQPSPEERAAEEARYQRFLSGQDAGLELGAGTGTQDFGASVDMGKSMEDFGTNLQDIMDNRGGFTSQWQQVGTDRVMVRDDGTGIGINENGDSYALSVKDVGDMIRNGQLNTFASGYNTATGGNRIAPGGGSSVVLKNGKEGQLLTDGKVIDKDTGKVIGRRDDVKSVITQDGDGKKIVTNPPPDTSKPPDRPRPPDRPKLPEKNNNMILALLALMALMNRGGGGGSGQSAVIPSLAADRRQLPYGPAAGSTARPGAGGVTYFSPTTYTRRAAGGGLMSLAGGGISNLGSYSDGGRLLKGPGDGVSDSIPATIGGKQPARLATGEFVVPARIVSELGNGSTEAGAKKLYAMMDRVQKARRRTKNVAADTKAHKYLPA